MATDTNNQPNPSAIAEDADILFHLSETRATNHFVLFFVILILEPTPAPTLNLYAGSKSMISYDNAVSIIAAKADAKEASGKCLGTN